jgi:hypothetical protein
VNAWPGRPGFGFGPESLLDYGAAIVELARDPRWVSTTIALGEQFGEQIEQNWKELRSRKSLQTRTFKSGQNWIFSAGGRAVAGSNPVSPIAKCMH